MLCFLRELCPLKLFVQKANRTATAWEVAPFSVSIKLNYNMLPLFVFRTKMCRVVQTCTLIGRISNANDANRRGLVPKHLAVRTSVRRIHREPQKWYIRKNVFYHHASSSHTTSTGALLPYIHRKLQRARSPTLNLL